MKYKSIRLAAIDIGSNGARLLIKNFQRIGEDEEIISRVMYMRIPLRLGVDVFSLGKISKQRIFMMRHMLKAFKQIMKLNRVDDYRACATAAMRDAAGGKKLLRKLCADTGVDIEIIEGKEEALLLCNNIIENTCAADGDFAYADVGGGSTEISLLHNGTLKHSRSYNIGTLRMLSGGVSKDTLMQMETDLKAFSSENAATDKTDGGIKLIGSGGNINKLFKLAHGDKTSRMVAMSEIEQVYNILLPMSVEERIAEYGLKADRADVIVPAAEIFMKIAKSLGCDSIQVPNISLADCIVDGLYRNKYKS